MPCALCAATAGGGADHTSGSMDFGLLGVHGAGGGGVGGGTGGTDLDASMHTLDDFAAPPDLHAHLGVAPVTQHSGSMAAMAAAAAAAAPHVAAVAVAAAPAPDAVPDHVQVPPVSFQVRCLHAGGAANVRFDRMWTAGEV